MNCCKNKEWEQCLFKRYCILIIFFINLLAMQPVYASNESNGVELNYFYISACAACHDVDEYLVSVSDQCYPKIKEKNEELYIYKYNTSEEDNLNLLEKFYDAYKVPEKDRTLPVVFFGSSYISGEKEIKLRLENELPEAEPGSPVKKNVKSGSNEVLGNFEGLRPVSSFVTGFINGLTPCSLSMLLFFISLLIARNVSIIRMGLLYCAGKFITYLFLGTLLFKTLGSINAGWLGIAVKSLMLVAILIFIILNAMDFFAARSERYEKIKLQLPVRLRGFNHRWIKAVSAFDSPASLAGFSLLLGAVTSVGEFLCTGQLYLTTILYALHSQTSLNMKALIYFMEYNLAFITPLLIITFIISRGKGILDVSEFIRRNMHIIKLINIIVFLAFGLYLVLFP
jgi:cytochrome c biogenesis protein CcdA